METTKSIFITTRNKKNRNERLMLNNIENFKTQWILIYQTLIGNILKTLI